MVLLSVAESPLPRNSTKQVEIHVLFLFLHFYRSCRFLFFGCIGCGSCVCRWTARWVCGSISLWICQEFFHFLNLLEREISFSNQGSHIPECISQSMWQPSFSRNAKFAAECCHVSNTTQKLTDKGLVLDV